MKYLAVLCCISGPIRLDAVAGDCFEEGQQEQITLFGRQVHKRLPGLCLVMRMLERQKHGTMGVTDSELSPCAQWLKQSGIPCGGLHPPVSGA